MDDAFISLVIVSLVVLAVVASGLLAVYSWTRIDHPVSESYGLLMAADSVWAGGYLLMIIGSGGLLTEFGLFVKALFSVLAGVAWLLFVSEYTGDSELIPTWVWWLLTAEAVLFGLLVGLNPGGLVIDEIVVGEFGLFTFAVESAGIVVVGQLLISTVMIGVSFFFLGRFILQTQTVFRYQALIIFGIGVIVYISVVLFISGVQILPLVDTTPILFNIQAIGVGWALYRYDFLKLSPVVIRQFFREMNDPVLIMDANFIVADYNASADELVEGLRPQVPVSEIDDNNFSQVLEESIRTGDADEFTTLVTDGGSRQTYDIEQTQVTDQFDVTRGYVVVLRDISDRKRRERRLRNQNERLAEFADIVSHDLRNPLSTAAGWTELLDRQLDKSEPDPERLQEAVDQMSASHERMDELIEVLLTMAREGQTVDDPEAVSLTAVATEAWSTADTGSLELVVGADRTIEADPARLKSVFENLFRNANDHAGATTVSVSGIEDGFVIEDDGQGIGGDDHESLFEFGYSTDEEGTGIGLAVVKRICEAHGWEITAAASSDGGTRFEITGVAMAEAA